MAEKKKTAVFFKTARGDEPVFDYLESISQEESGRLYALIQELEFYGRLSEPHGKKLSGFVYEIRSGRHRILYGYGNGHVILLHAFAKKRQKTDPDDIALAEKRLKEAKQREGSK